MNRVEEKIRDLYPSLTRKQQGISQYIIENPEETAFLSLSRLARKSRVSEASVNRFSLALGYDGYSEMQKDLQSWIKSRITPLVKIKKSISNDPSANIYLKVIDTDGENLDFLREKIPQSQLNQAVRYISGARRVYVIGMRSSYAPAFLLNHYLNHVGIVSELLDPHAGRLLDRIMRLSRKDALVGISFPRYFKQTVEVLGFARDRQCKTIVITDNVLSPAAQNGDVVITARYHTPIPFLSYVSVISLINCLIFGIVMGRKSQSVAAVAGTEKLLEKWNSILGL